MGTNLILRSNPKPCGWSVEQGPIQLLLENGIVDATWAALVFQGDEECFSGVSEEPVVEAKEDVVDCGCGCEKG